MNNRNKALDVFRGGTVALMIIVNNQGSFSNLYWPVGHASWNGCTLADLVFPFFLLAVGNSLAFVTERLSIQNDSFFLKKVFKRSILIFLLGLLINWAPFFKWENDTLVFKQWEHIRIPGVLQRIAICYFFAAILVYKLKEKSLVFISLITLTIYWIACLWLGKNDPYSALGYFGTAIDVFLLGENHMYKGEGFPFDPEGIASTLPAIIQVIIGYFIGKHIIKKGNSYEMLSQLLIGGVLLTIIGLTWNVFFPVNKKLWSSSYVFLTSGIAVLITGLITYVTDLKNIKSSVVDCCEIFGKNPLFIFVISGLVPRLLGIIRIPSSTDLTGKTTFISPLKWLYEDFCKAITANPKMASLVYSFLFLIVYWTIAYILHRKKIIIKI